MGSPARPFGPTSSTLSLCALGRLIVQRSGSLESVAPPLNRLPSQGLMASHSGPALVHAGTALLSPRPSGSPGGHIRLAMPQRLPPAADQWRPGVGRCGEIVDQSLGISTPAACLPLVGLSTGAESSSQSGPAADRRARTGLSPTWVVPDTRPPLVLACQRVLPRLPRFGLASPFCQRRRMACDAHTRAPRAQRWGRAACRSCGGQPTELTPRKRRSGGHGPSVCLLAVLARVGTPPLAPCASHWGWSRRSCRTRYSTLPRAHRAA